MRKVLKALKAFFTNKWVIAVLVITAIVALIWFGGPLISIAEYKPLESEVARLATLFAITLLWALYNFFQKTKANKNNQKLVESMVEQPLEEDEHEKLSKEEVAVLQDRMKQALSILQKNQLNGKNIYQLPWFVMIGPPGAGKTTTIMNSGVRLPLKDAMGGEPVKGVGGTRNCDWWFTNEAVLLDTAGRYTTQDSYEEVDSRAWHGFLNLLKDTRPMRPVNGAILAISLAEIAGQTQTERNDHAQAIRQRIQELKVHLGVNVPVYVMLTKADLLAGFEETFDDLSKEEREQVLGFTFDINDNYNENGAIADFNRSFVELIKEVEARVLKRLKQERDPERKALIFNFPRQLRMAQKGIDDFLKEAFLQNRYEEPFVLRGVYLVSATQEGSPIDRISSSLSKNFGFKLKSNKGGDNSGKGYFIKNVFTKLIFRESELVGTNIKYEKKQQMIRYVGYAACLLASLVVSYLWINSYYKNQDLIEHTAHLVEEYDTVTEGGLKTDSNVLELNDGLNVLRKFPEGYAPINEAPLAMRFGLYQGHKFGGQAREAYQKALRGFFGPFLQGSIEGELANATENTDYLYEMLRLYLMFYEPEHMEYEDIQNYFGLYLNREHRGDLNAQFRSQMLEHLVSYLELRIPFPKRDVKLVDYAQDKLSSVSLVDRAYARLKEEYRDAMPSFQLSNNIPLNMQQYFYRKSGKALDEGIPGLFTYAGYHGVFKSESEKITKLLAEESWVLPDQQITTMDDQQITKLRLEVQNKYFQDYIYMWRNLINDIEVREFSTPAQGALMLEDLTGVNSPIKRIFEAVRDNVMLSKQEKSGIQDVANMADNAPDGLSQTRVGNRVSRINRMMPKNMDAYSQEENPEKVVDRAFKDIIDFAGQDDGQPTRLDTTLDSMKSLQAFLESISNANNKAEKTYQATSSPEAATVINNIGMESRSTPKPMNSWLTKIESSGKTLTTSGTYSYLNDTWRSEILPECRRAIQGRYPVDKSSSKEITLDDFSSFFGYQGRMDTFFNQHLKVFVDTSSSPWKLHRDIGISRSTLRQFENAKKIRETFFAKGSNEPSIKFSLKPTSLSVNVKQFFLEMEGQVLSYRHGPARQYPMRWPGPDSSGLATVTFTPASGFKNEVIQGKGFWSLFRLLDKGEVRETISYDKFFVEFKRGDFSSILELQANSVKNPFYKSVLEGFRCPSNL
ncbi:type VI secretion system membrane subunit TssM [Kangiella spongicola]|uniref:Type VI secretion system membrane subunit TssM n=1 Tax=Kangiella spongicola TaxID=796379 RepID=A0A318D8H0_9GAMM|nr:type VI secretion system membrane subunit TssM [Kangiella spongicola]PXF64205.1 type VI secretion system membrane subunit TssM [Kangiella spongicola]